MTRAGLSRRDWLALGAVAAGAVGVGALLRQGRPVGRDVSQIDNLPAILNAPGFPEEGPADPSVVMLVFSDYACGVCRQTEPVWREAVNAAGDVRVVHRDWPILGAPSVRAAQVALAAYEQRRYVPVHDALMQSSGLGEPALRNAVESTGADWAHIERDLAAKAEAINALLARTANDAFRLGFRGTPGYLIGPIRIEGSASRDDFLDAIERAREAG